MYIVVMLFVSMTAMRTFAVNDISEREKFLASVKCEVRFWREIPRVIISHEFILETLVFFLLAAIGMFTAKKSRDGRDKVNYISDGARILYLYVRFCGCCGNGNSAYMVVGSRGKIRFQSCLFCGRCRRGGCLHKSHVETPSFYKGARSYLRKTWI